VIDGFSYFRKGSNMSLAVAEAPAPVSASFDDLKTRIEAFNQTHTHGVLRDYNAADKYYSRHPQITSDGRLIPLRLTITPSKLAYRLKDKSFVLEDFEAPGCERVVWMRNLYRALCPADMRVEFGASTAFKPNCGSILEDVFMPVVSFIKSTPSKRGHRQS
jgi:hypothetical protein